MIAKRTSFVIFVLNVFVIGACPAFAQAPAPERPPVGPERPFQLAPRVEKTLANGFRVIVARQTAVPKVTITLSTGSPGLP